MLGTGDDDLYYPGMYKRDTDYAVTLADVPNRPLRPLRGRLDPDRAPQWMVYDPDDPLDAPMHCPDARIIVHGEWDHPAHPMTGARGRTWAEFAADQLRHVTEQRRLVERLTKLGIRRNPEPYIHRFEAGNAMDIDLILTYRELSTLLTKAGV